MPIILGTLQAENNLSDVENPATARSNIGAGIGNMIGSNNLSEITSPAAARSNIGAGNMVSTNNLSEITNPTTARSNIGAGTGNGDMVGSNNLSDVTNAATARSNIGAGDVSAASIIPDNRVVRGNGGSKGVQQSGVTIDDSNNVTGVARLTTNNNVQIGGQGWSDTAILSDAPTIATNCNNGNVFTVTLAGNRTLGAPTNLQNGGTYIWIIKQSGGSNTLSYNAVFKFPGGTAPTLSTAAGAVDILSGVSDGTNVYCNMVNDLQ